MVTHTSVHQQRQACHGLSRVIRLDGETPTGRPKHRSLYKIERGGGEIQHGLTFRWPISGWRPIHLRRPPPITPLRADASPT